MRAGSVRATASRLSCVTTTTESELRSSTVERLQHRRGVERRSRRSRPARRAACRSRPTFSSTVPPALVRPRTLAVTITWSSSAPSTFSGVALRSLKCPSRPVRKSRKPSGPRKVPPHGRTDGALISPSGATTLVAASMSPGDPCVPGPLNDVDVVLRHQLISIRRRSLRATPTLRQSEADGRTRTGDPFITSEVLYQLSYVGARVSVVGVRRRSALGEAVADAPDGEHELRLLRVALDLLAQV